MPTLSKKNARILLTLLCCLSAAPVMATHLVGDEFTYKYLGETSVYGVMKHKYEVTLNIYADCVGGDPASIAEDNPAFFAAYNGTTLLSTDSINFSSSVALPVYSIGPCGSGGIPLCVIKKTFVKVYYLPVGAPATTIVYQRCCKNGALTNIVHPAGAGSTYYCTIPSTTVATNSSAVFTTYPPMEIALGYPFVFDHSATDADGDSLSYELCNTYQCGSTVTKPFPPMPPPYDASVYVAPRSFSDPMPCSAPLTIDPVTGILSGTPNVVGRYLISVCCHEWRGGVMINTSQREFEFAVTSFSGSTYRPFAGNDTFIYVGDTLQFSASGAASYSWSPATYLSATSVYNPVGRYPVAGTFSYALYGISDSGCAGYDTINVNVLEHSEFMAPNAFTPNNDGINDYFTAIPVKNAVLSSMRIYNSQWHLIYSGSGPNARWDGNFNGTKQNIGSYYYELLYTDNKGATRSKSGSLTLIR